jgi:heavy metal translocating P-type ATPase
MRTSERASCDYCNLPLPRSLGGRDAAGDEDVAQYCCFGCRFAAAVVQERGEEGTVRWTLTRLGLAIFFTMNVMVFTMALWTLGLPEAAGTGRMAASYRDVFRYLALLFSLPVLFLLGQPLLEGAVDGLRRGVFSTDLLLASGVFAAFAYSAVSVAMAQGDVYFEVGCVILVMVTLGRWLEATGKLKTSNALDALEKLLPERVRRIRDGVEKQVPLAEIVVGDHIRVLPGERFPADGRLVGDEVSVDQQILTGESRAVVKHAGDAIFGGTLNLDGDVGLDVTATGPEAALMRLVDLVRRARAAKGRYERLADRVSGVFAPIVAVVALATLTVHALSDGLEHGILAALAVTLIACPCSLGLATPLAVWNALGHAARRQILFRSGEVLERLATIRAIRFDKTGTLTTGTPRVSGVIAEESDPDLVLRRAAGLAEGSTHALSVGIRAFAGPKRDSFTAVRVASGRGVVGNDKGSGTLVTLGSPQFMTARGLVPGPALQEAVRQARARGLSITLVGWDGRVRGLFLFDEQLRPSAATTIAWCRAAGYDVAVLTGDHAERGEALAAQLGIPVVADLMPEDKIAAIRQARDQIGPVLMVGDGINDAPALAASDVGVALSCGTDVSRDSAQVCLLGDDLDRLPWCLDLARRTVRVIRGNLFWSFAYNSVGIACAALGWLNPALAAFLMVGSSAFVLVNSLRLGNDGSVTGVAMACQEEARLGVPFGTLEAAR